MSDSSNFRELAERLCQCLGRSPLLESFGCLHGTRMLAVLAAVYTTIYTTTAVIVTVSTCTLVLASDSDLAASLFTVQIVDYCITFLASWVVLYHEFKDLRTRCLLFPFIMGNAWMFIIEWITQIAWMDNLGPSATTPAFIVVSSGTFFNILSFVFVISRYQDLANDLPHRRNQVNVLPL